MDGQRLKHFFFVILILWKTICSALHHTNDIVIIVLPTVKLWTYWARANCTILVILCACSLTHTSHIERAQNSNLMTLWARIIWHNLVVLSAFSLTQTGRIERAQYDNYMTYWARANVHGLVILRERNFTQTGQTEYAQNDNFRSQSIAPIWPINSVTNCSHLQPLSHVSLFVTTCEDLPPLALIEVNLTMLSFQSHWFLSVLLVKLSHELTIIITKHDLL